MSNSPMQPYINKKVEIFRKAYQKAYGGILNLEILEQGNKWFEDFLRTALTSAIQHGREERDLDWQTAINDTIVNSNSLEEAIKKLSILTLQQGEINK